MVWVINARVFLKKSEKTIILDFFFGTLRLSVPSYGRFDSVLAVFWDLQTTWTCFEIP